MKRWWILAAALLLLLCCGCENGAGGDALVTPQTGPNDDLRPYYPEEAIPVVLDAHYLDNGDVQVTIHGGLLINDESEVLNDQQIADGFISGVRNEDQSVTYVIAGDRYDEFLANHKKRCRDAIINGAASGAYESIYAAEPTEDFSYVKATADTEGYSGLDASEAIFETGYYAIRAQAFDVNAVGKCLVEVVDETSGEVLTSRVYPEEFDLFPVE
ncbi:MAG: hypothetical protein IKV35_03640 [Clostridia bacterium]|nr:hypothetical protein [Clostridia bacterium]